MRILNRKARVKYFVLERTQAGIELKGAEVKSVREGRGNLNEAFVKLRGQEAWLINAYIHPFKGSETLGLDPTRSRRLLLHKREILNWQGKVAQKGLTILPLSMYTTPRLIKLELALCQPKKKFDKRRAIKERDLKRELERELKGGP